MNLYFSNCHKAAEASATKAAASSLTDDAEECGIFSGGQSPSSSSGSWAESPEGGLTEGAETSEVGGL